MAHQEPPAPEGTCRFIVDLGQRKNWLGTTVGLLVRAGADGLVVVDVREGDTEIGRWNRDCRNFTMIGSLNDYVVRQHDVVLAVNGVLRLPDESLENDKRCQRIVDELSGGRHVLITMRRPR